MSEFGNFRESVASAPGKVILFGEHAVVYGKVALASGLGLRTTTRITPVSGNNININLGDISTIKRTVPTDDLTNIRVSQQNSFKKIENSDPDPKVIDALEKYLNSRLENLEKTEHIALLAFFYMYLYVFQENDRVFGSEIEVSSNLPVGAGLGSSAAYSVSLSAALLGSANLISKDNWKKEEVDFINEWAFCLEKILHGTPSGIDNSVSSYGGCISFKRPSEIRHLNMPTLKICLVHTHVPRSTKLLVAGVKEKRDLCPSVFDNILEAMGKISEEVIELFTTLSQDEFDKKEKESARMKLDLLVDTNQNLLDAIGVGHQSLTNVCSISHKYGLNAKLTGAGGGGCAFILLKDDIDETKITEMYAELEKENFTCLNTTVGGPGVLPE